MDQDSSASSARLPWVVLFLLLGMLVAGAVTWRWVQSGPGPTQATGDDVPIELLAVQVDGDEAAYAPDGRPLPGPLYHAGFLSHWRPDHMQRTFVLRTPPLVRPPTIAVSVAGQGPVAAGTWIVPSWKGTRLESGVQLYATELQRDLPRRFRLPVVGPVNFGRRDVDRVDVTVSIHHGPRRRGHVEFHGPFQRGQVYEASRIPGVQPVSATMVLSPRAGHHPRLGTHIRLTDLVGVRLPVSVFDRQGERHGAQYAGDLATPKGVYDVWVDLPLDQVNAVVVNEQMLSRTFHNVHVRFRNHPPRQHARWVDELAQRLQRPVADFAKGYRPRNAGETRKVLDLLPPDLAAAAILEHFRSAQQGSDADRQRVAGMAHQWLDEPLLREQAVLIGLWARDVRFIDPAIDLAFELEDNQATDIAWGLHRSADLLSTEQVARIRTRLLEDPQIAGHDQLVAAIDARDDDELLPFVTSSSTALWWMALWRVDAPSNKRLAGMIASDEALAIRRIQARGPEVRPKPSPELVRRAMEGLPALLTTDLLRANSFVASQIVDRMGEHGDPKVCTPPLIQFLQCLLDDPHITDRANRTSPNPDITVKIVKQLNDWHGVNIGGIGGRQSGMWNAVEWTTLATQAVRWSRSGQAPENLPTAWRPGSDDLRVILYSQEDPSQSVIAITPAAGADDAAPAMLSLLELHLSVCAVRVDEGRWELTVDFGQRFNDSQGRFLLSSSDLPWRMPMPDSRPWTLWVEPLAERQSVLGDAPLLAAWRQTYLEAGPDQPLPRVFHQQQREALRAVLDRRSFDPHRDGGRAEDGWTPAQVALWQVARLLPERWSELYRSVADPTPAAELEQAWRRFLERDDLTVEMRVLACHSLAETLVQQAKHDDAPSRQRRAEAGQWYERAWRIDPDYVCHQTVTSAVAWAGTSRDQVERCRRTLEAYQWLISRTEAQIQQSSRRPMLSMQPGRPPMQVYMPPQAPGRQSSLARMIEFCHENMDGIIRNSAKQDAARTIEFIQGLGQSVEPALRDKWLQIARSVAPSEAGR